MHNVTWKPDTVVNAEDTARHSPYTGAKREVICRQYYLYEPGSLPALGP